MSGQTLQELYRSDQGKVSDRWQIYLDVYGSIFAAYRDRPLSLFEIGIQNGGSLEIWSRYFENAVKLVGCDINPQCADLRFEDARISVVVGDANSDEAEREVMLASPAYDIIIDDGSHASGDIVKSFWRYFRYVRNGGLYVVEDLHCSYWAKLGGGLFEPFSAISFFKRLIDITNYEHWGLSARPVSILAPFFSHYGVALTEETEPGLNAVLSCVRSVEFVNSLCIIRKESAASNRLGDRIVCGVEENAVGGLLPLRGTAMLGYDQLSEGVCKDPILAEKELTRVEKELTRVEKELNLALAELQDRDARIVSLQADIALQTMDVASARSQVAELLGSSSWRMTRPFRVFSGLLRKEPAYQSELKRILKPATPVGDREPEPLDTFRIALPAPGTEPQPPFHSDDYEEWVRRYDTLDEGARDRIRLRIGALGRKPKISIVMPVYDPPLRFLDAAIFSVRSQLYQNWELCIADDHSKNQDVRDLLLRHAAEDSRIKVVLRDTNGNISAASNSALELATGEYVALLDHDDVLAEHALFWVASTILDAHDAALIYSDEDKISETGSRYAPYFKCDYNRELLLAHNMISHLGVYRRDLLEAVGGFREGFEGAQDYDLALRVIERVPVHQIRHIPRVLYHWRAIAGSTALAGGEKDYAVSAARRAIAEHLERSGVVAEVGPALDAPGYNRVQFSLPNPAPMVSIVIPTRDRVDLLRTCVESIINLSTYPRWELIIVDNSSVEQETAKFLRSLPERQVRVIREDTPFNFSRLNNQGVAAARGELICLLNNDIEVLSHGWLEELASFACQADIGCVGARLWYPDGRMQHGGVFLGYYGVAGHAHKFLSTGEIGYFGRAALHQSVSAVTAAALLVRRAVFEEVGGLDEDFAVAFNDIDFCLRVRAAGYRNVWTPYAEMIHHESATRGYEDNPEKQVRFQGEIRRMRERWGDQLLTDPAYSPNLTLYYEDFSLAWPPRVADI